MNRNQWGAVAWLCAFMASVDSIAASPEPLLDAHTVRTRAEHWLARYAAAGDFNGVVLIAQGSQVLVGKAFRSKEVRHEHLSVDTRFRIASLSKTFTAAAIEQLATEGKLSQNDTLEQYVKGVPNGAQITIEQLLRHASGVGVLDGADVTTECLPTEDLLDRLRKATPLFAPGKGDAYSNEGYLLLGAIIERVTGASYSDAMAHRLFEPLKLTNTGVACKGIPPGDDAIGHYPDASATGVQPVLSNEATWNGPGSIYSDAHDLYTWLRAVDADENYRNDKFAYPYGWSKRNYSGHRPLIEQSGIETGFTAHAALYREGHIYAIVLNSVQSGFQNIVPKDLEAVLFGGTISTPPVVHPIMLDERSLAAYPGTYRTPNIGYPMILSIHDGALTIRWGDSPFLRALTPTGKDSFFYRSEYANVTFQRDGQGYVTATTWQWPAGDPLELTRQKGP